MSPEAIVPLTDILPLLECRGFAYEQADHFAGLSGLFGEGAVLIGPPDAARDR